MPLGSVVLWVMSQCVITMTPTTDLRDGIADLVQRAQAGDREAFGELVERLWADLVALARGILAADGEAEDLVQDALIHAWPRLRSLRRPESFAAWMRRIVARRCLSRVRRRRPTLELVELPDRRTDPAAGVDAAQLLGTLAPRQRAVLYLTWIEGCNDREAGDILGISAATVRVHRHRGLNQLRRIVEANR
jgi:RNA polymerase sigma-70 factor (ECF subfamily)